MVSKIFIKILPYLLIVSIGVSMYFGFRYMSNKISESEQKAQCLLTENESLKMEVESLKAISDISVKQIENIRNYEHEAQENVSSMNSKIDGLKLNKVDAILLEKINAYQDCIAENSLHPEIVCPMEF